MSIKSLGRCAAVFALAITLSVPTRAAQNPTAKRHRVAARGIMIGDLIATAATGDYLKMSLLLGNALTNLSGILIGD